MWKWFYQLASPPTVYRLACRLAPYLLVGGALAIAIALWGGLFVAPPDYQQSDAFRIIYIHVPAAYLSLMAYTLIAAGAIVGFIWRIKVGHYVGAAAAPVGAAFTALALLTGMIWGRPMWGTWWEWGDPRLTSELILLFLYFGLMALRAALPEVSKGDQASGLLAIVGLVNIPIIHYSVEWWSSLHQGATLIRADGPAMPKEMLWPLLTSLAGFTLLFAGMVALRLRSVILSRERRARWVGSDVTALAGDNTSMHRVETAFWVVAAMACLGFGLALTGVLGNPLRSLIVDSMSGYGGFVWSAYLATLVIAGWNLVRPLTLQRRALVAVGTSPGGSE